jgi:hypothetical protein
MEPPFFSRSACFYAEWENFETPIDQLFLSEACSRIISSKSTLSMLKIFI